MSYLTGKLALQFNLLDSIGTRHRLEDFKGSWLLMVFHRHLG
jgi:peroxiredoxin